MIGLTELQLSVLAIAIFITGVSKSGFAGGMGAITVPMLSVVMEPVLAIALMLPTLILMDGLSLRAWWGYYQTSLLKVLIPAGFIGIGIGYLMLNIVSEAQVIFLLGVTTILLGCYGLFPKQSQVSLSNFWGYPLGLLSGFTSFIAHAGGPPLNAFLLSKQLSKKHFLGTAVVFFAFINLAKVPPYIGLGQFTWENVFVAAAFIPISFLGIRSGIRLQGRLSDKVFFRVINVLMIGLGIHLVLKA